MKFWLKIAALVIVTLLGFAAIESASPSFQICIDQTQSRDSNQPEERPIYIFDALNIYCAGTFIDQNRDSIIALATMLLALVTGGLVWVAYQQFKTPRAQLRAYLSVVIGSGAYQDRSRNIRFEGAPTLRNNGQTPAYKVRFEIRAAIIPDNLVADYEFKVPASGVESQSTIGPGEERILRAWLPDYVNDSDVPDIKSAKGRALHVWGIVHYEDVFRQPHFVKFCQHLVWLPDGLLLVRLTPS
jgi:hypothetical protein